MNSLAEVLKVYLAGRILILPVNSPIIIGGEEPTTYRLFSASGIII
jgi:hypothetical protein